MYSLPIMTFDTSFPPLDESSPAAQAIWSVLRTALEAFTRIPSDMYKKENFDQFAMFFELLDVIPGGHQLLTEITGSSIIPRISGPSANVPSRLHTRTVHAMLDSLGVIYSVRRAGSTDTSATSPASLLKASEGFDIVNEFSGLRGVFPIDAAVYHNNQLVALVEIDGEFHYKALGQNLRRKDQFKEFLYRCHYPYLPLFRIRSDQCAVIGTDRAGEALATWIVNSMDERDQLVADKI